MNCGLCEFYIYVREEPKMKHKFYCKFSKEELLYIELDGKCNNFKSCDENLEAIIKNGEKHKKMVKAKEV